MKNITKETNATIFKNSDKKLTVPFLSKLLNRIIYETDSVKLIEFGIVLKNVSNSAKILDEELLATFALYVEELKAASNNEAAFNEILNNINVDDIIDNVICRSKDDKYHCTESLLIS